jgi:hypothetical protein
MIASGLISNLQLPELEKVAALNIALTGSVAAATSGASVTRGEGGSDADGGGPPGEAAGSGPSLADGACSTCWLLPGVLR